MIVKSSPSAVVICPHCKKPGHRFQSCVKRIGMMSGKTPPLTPRTKELCSLHNNTDRNDNSDCRSQVRDDNETRRHRPGQQNGAHNNNCSAHTNTETTSNPTTPMAGYVPVSHAPSTTTAAAATAATLTCFVTPPCPSSPPVGVDYSFIAADPMNIVAQPIQFSLSGQRSF